MTNITNGEGAGMSVDYAVVLIESNEKYGYLSDEAKEIFYNAFAKPTENQDSIYRG